MEDLKTKSCSLCEGCDRIDRIAYADGFFCSGNVKKPEPEFDTVRICVYRNSEWLTADWAADEALAQSILLNRAVMEGLFENINYRKFRRID